MAKAATIHKDRAVFTVIFEFDVQPDQQPKLAEEIQRLVGEIVSKQPGFISCNLHLSSDGQKVLNYFQWESADAFSAFRNDEDKQRHIRPVLAPYGPKPRVYSVVFSAGGE